MGRWGSLRSLWIGQSLCSKTGVRMCQTQVEMAKVSPYKPKDRALFRSWHLIGANLSWWTHLKWLVIHMGLLLTRRFNSLATPLFWSNKGRTSNKRWTLKSLISRLIKNQGTRHSSHRTRNDTLTYNDEINQLYLPDLRHQTVQRGRLISDRDQELREWGLQLFVVGEDVRELKWEVLYS